MFFCGESMHIKSLALRGKLAVCPGCVAHRSSKHTCPGNVKCFIIEHSPDDGSSRNVLGSSAIGLDISCTVAVLADACDVGCIGGNSTSTALLSPLGSYPGGDSDRHSCSAESSSRNPSTSA